MNFAIYLIIAMACGVLAGLGIGGGTLLVVALTLIFKVEQLEAQAINLAFFLAAAPCALFGHIKNRLISWKAVLFALPAGVVTALFASIWAQDFDPLWLKRIFGVLLAVIGIKELFAKAEKKTEGGRD